MFCLWVLQTHRLIFDPLCCWICKLISQAYAIKDKASPFPAEAHSTRRVRVSYTIQHHSSASKFGKGATLTSFHTFTKFYNVNVLVSADASIGQKFLLPAL